MKRHTLLALVIAASLAWAQPLNAAADVSDFDILGIKLGMTADEVVAQAHARGFDDVKRSRAPSFEQAVAIENREQVLPRNYAGAQLIRFRNDQEAAEVSFVQMPSGSRAARITYHFFGSDVTLDRMTDQVLEKYGDPEQKNDRYWLWGDAADYAVQRKDPYLEFDRNPLTTFALVRPLAGLMPVRSLAGLTLGHNSMQEQSRQAIADAAAESTGGAKPRF